MAVRKKVTKTEEQKTVKTKVKKPEVPRLTQIEMRKLEELSSGITYGRSQCNLYDQFAANIVLKKEKLLSDIKLLDYELNKARDLQKREAEKQKAIEDKLKNYGEEIKKKYKLGNVDGLKYDPKTGELK